MFQPKQWAEKGSREDNRKQDPTRTCAQSGVKIEHCSRCPLVYQIVKTTFEHRVELMKAHPVAKETVPENIERNTLFPVHPGALRYYREKGIAVPPATLGATN